MKCEKCQIPDGSPAKCVHMAGRKGGRNNAAAKLAADPDYFRKLGTKGGNRVKELMGRAFYQGIGKKGGEKVKAELGPAHYHEIGKKGGEIIRDTLGHEHFSEIGRKGGAKVKEMIEAGKRAESAEVKS